MCRVMCEEYTVGCRVYSEVIYSEVITGYCELCNIYSEVCSLYSEVCVVYTVKCSVVWCIE